MQAIVLSMLILICPFVSSFGVARSGIEFTKWKMLSTETDSIFGKYLSKSKPIFIAGGSSGVGYEVVKRLSALGVPTKVLVRWPDAQAMLNTLPKVTAILGDALDEAAVQNCMLDCVAAITTLGGSPTDGQGKRVDYFGNSNVVEQAGILGVERIVLVTSVGCGESIGAIPQETYRALEEALEAKSKAERDLKLYTNLDWTIIRPGGLKTAPATGEAVLTEDVMASGSITREDCADLIIKVLGSESCTRRALTAVDPTQETASSKIHYAAFPIK